MIRFMELIQLFLGFENSDLIGSPILVQIFGLVHQICLNLSLILKRYVFSKLVPTRGYRLAVT